MEIVRRAWNVLRNERSTMASLVGKLKHGAQVLKEWDAKKALFSIAA